MDYEASPPEVIAAAIAEEIDRPVAYRPVERDGAARAAALIAPAPLTTQPTRQRFGATRIANGYSAS